ncbi:hypothetical protein [Kitasatospora purpeofusca]|uniref:hypothetical protein n=1 Tax=Kitasatospora purpeofusca TaxID=67352 RepID=UPI002250AE36|nr:hypothetical protein [Kitasatospora purpeofusca]MCX4754067.1 hypothetical protein [Kitasatospora purpeofusca]WSR33515.1 hypothetical protein OG715_22530 [Kitasatospora purpeofusca]WSR41598.1 hypothetical protein OG196_22330 [Kitasatospora purpeofusca]
MTPPGKVRKFPQNGDNPARSRTSHSSEDETWSRAMYEQTYEHTAVDRTDDDTAWS